MDKPALLPCPCCGAAAMFITERDDDGQFTTVSCTGCGMGSGKHYPLMDDAHPAAANEWNRRAPRISTAARDVLRERERQVSKEGWTTGHDDTHNRGELAAAAACYAMPESHREMLPARRVKLTYIHKYTYIPERPRLWPWSYRRWKPSDRRRNLIKAGALILAEIERLDRLTAAEADHG